MSALLPIAVIYLTDRYQKKRHLITGSNIFTSEVNQGQLQIQLLPVTKCLFVACSYIQLLTRKIIPEINVKVKLWGNMSIRFIEKEKEYPTCVW